MGPAVGNRPDLTPEQVFEIRRLARIELARVCAKEGDILGWGKALFPYKFPLPFCHELHGYFVDIRGEEFTSTEAPRSHAKTQIKCFLIPIYQALNEPETFRHYLNVQATESKAMDANRSIKKELEENAELKEIYGDMIGDRWTEKQFVLRNGVVFSGVGAGQSIRGMNYRSYRPDYIIVDDLYDEEDINNPESTEKKNAWFWGSLYPARAQSKRCSMHIQGTAINNEDILEQLKKQADVKSATFRRVKDWDKKIVLWPELNSFEDVMRDRGRMSETIFFRESQNERRDDSTSIVKSSWLAEWEYDPAQLKFNSHFFLSGVMIGCDPSIGEKTENDFTGIALIYKTSWDDGSGHRYYIDGLWNEHISLDERVRLLEKIASEQPTERQVTQVNIESIAGFKDFTAEVRRRTNLPVKEIDRVKDKISNLESKSHYFENKKVFINQEIDPKLKDMLKYQLITNHPKHDDLRDAVLLTLDDSSGLWGFVG